MEVQSKIVISEEAGKRQAQIDGNKNYPKTVQENINILKEYLNLLKNENIKPIIIICPVTKYYSDYFPQRLKNEFLSIINKLQNEYEFEIIDCFESSDYNESDFYDVSRLNEKGAFKFAKYLEDVMLS